MAPSLFAGMGADDWLHRLHLDPNAPVRPHSQYGTLLGAFEFFPSDRAEFQKLRDEGVLPWWVGAEVSGVFFRPLTVVTQWIDWRLWGEQLWLHHLHSITWFFLTVLAAGRFFQLWLGEGRAAALATLLFAVNDSHAMPVGWLANRNGLLALFFSILAATSHLRAVAGVPRAALWTGVWVAAALCSAEAGTAGLLLLLVLEFSVTRPPGERLRRWAPALLVAAAWAAAWKGLGFGIQGSALYVDPVRETGRYLMLLPERLGALSAAAWFNLPVDGWMTLTPALSRGIGVGLLLVCAGLVVRLVRGSADPRVHTALGLAILPLLPPLSAFPMSRLVGAAQLGVAGLLGLLWCAPSPGRLVRWLGHWHLVGAAALLLVQSVALRGLLWGTNEVAELVPDPPPGQEQHLILLQGFEIAVAYTGMIRRFQGRPHPASVLMLGPLATPLRITRLDDHRLSVEAPLGSFLLPGERLCRISPFHVGDVARTRLATVTVTSVWPDGAPRVWVVDLPWDLEDDRLVWREADGLGSVPWTPPAVGETVEVPAPLSLPWAYSLP